MNEKKNLAKDLEEKQNRINKKIDILDRFSKQYNALSSIRWFYFFHFSFSITDAASKRRFCSVGSGWGVTIWNYPFKQNNYWGNGLLRRGSVYSMSQITYGCVGGVRIIIAKRRIGWPSSNSSLVSCVQFRTNVLFSLQRSLR